MSLMFFFFGCVWVDVNEETDGLTYFRNASMTDTER